MTQFNQAMRDNFDLEEYLHYDETIPAHIKASILDLIHTVEYEEKEESEAVEKCNIAMTRVSAALDSYALQPDMAIKEAKRQLYWSSHNDNLPNYR